MFKTDFKREATSDLTGERGSLMGAIQGLFLAQYETLREHGHTPSEAFNETIEEFTQSLLPMVGKNGMDWMYANCSTTAQRGALDWMTPFHDAIKPVMENSTRAWQVATRLKFQSMPTLSPITVQDLNRNSRHSTKAKCGVLVKPCASSVLRTTKNLYMLYVG